jgi:hypothetical protein
MKINNLKIFLIMFAFPFLAFSQETVVVDVQMPCGVEGTPACVVEVDSSSLPSPTLDASAPTLTPDFSLISIAAPSINFVFPFQQVSCNQQGITRTVNGRSVTLQVNYCKVASVVNDVASLLAYFLTAGYLIFLAFKPRGD